LDPLALLRKHLGATPETLDIVYRHSRMVADKALLIARNVHASEEELRFIEEAALLHDIGVVGIHAPKLHCFGPEPYIRHGVIGRRILEDEGLPRHALVCERHIGVGLSVADIARQKLPLPPREMAPTDRCERIVALADLFFSKKEGELEREKSLTQVRLNLGKFGEEKLAILDDWLAEFHLENGTGP